jgi:hypothetical protein
VVRLLLAVVVLLERLQLNGNLLIQVKNKQRFPSE